MRKIEDDDDQIARDGQTIRVPMMLMDSVQRAVAANTILANDGAGHRPGFATLTDAMMKDRLKVYADYIARVTTAYKRDAVAETGAAAAWAKIVASGKAEFDKLDPGLQAAINKYAGKADKARKAAEVVRGAPMASLYDSYDARVANRWRGAA